MDIATAELEAWMRDYYHRVDHDIGSSGVRDLLVNCTPVGMHPHPDAMPVPASVLTGRYVYDLIYNPSITRLLRQATVAGCDIRWTCRWSTDCPPQRPTFETRR